MSKIQIKKINQENPASVETSNSVASDESPPSTRTDPSNPGTKFFVKLEDGLKTSSLSAFNEKSSSDNFNIICPNALSDKFTEFFKEKKNEFSEIQSNKNLLNWSLEDNAFIINDTNVSNADLSKFKYNKNALELDDYQREPAKTLEINKDTSLDNVLALIDIVNKINEHSGSSRLCSVLENRLKIISFIDKVLNSNSSLSDALATGRKHNKELAFSIYKYLDLIESKNKTNDSPTTTEKTVKLTNKTATTNSSSDKTNSTTVIKPVDDTVMKDAKNTDATSNGNGFGSSMLNIFDDIDSAELFDKDMLNIFNEIVSKEANLNFESNSQANSNQPHLEPELVNNNTDNNNVNMNNNANNVNNHVLEMEQEEINLDVQKPENTEPTKPMIIDNPVEKIISPTLPDKSDIMFDKPKETLYPFKPLIVNKTNNKITETNYKFTGPNHRIPPLMPSMPLLPQPALLPTPAISVHIEPPKALPDDEIDTNLHDPRITHYLKQLINLLMNVLGEISLRNLDQVNYLIDRCKQAQLVSSVMPINKDWIKSYDIRKQKIIKEVKSIIATNNNLERTQLAKKLYEILDNKFKSSKSSFFDSIVYYYNVINFNFNKFSAAQAKFTEIESNHLTELKLLINDILTTFLLNNQSNYNHLSIILQNDEIFIEDFISSILKPITMLIDGTSNKIDLLSKDPRVTRSNNNTPVDLKVLNFKSKNLNTIKDVAFNEKNYKREKYRLKFELNEVDMVKWISNQVDLTKPLSKDEIYEDSAELDMFASQSFSSSSKSSFFEDMTEIPLGRANHDQYKVISPDIIITEHSYAERKKVTETPPSRHIVSFTEFETPESKNALDTNTQSSPHLSTDDIVENFFDQLDKGMGKQDNKVKENIFSASFELNTETIMSRLSKNEDNSDEIQIINPEDSNNQNELSLAYVSVPSSPKKPINAINNDAATTSKPQLLNRSRSDSSDYYFGCGKSEVFKNILSQNKNIKRPNRWNSNNDKRKSDSEDDKTFDKRRRSHYRRDTDDGESDTTEDERRYEQRVSKRRNRRSYGDHTSIKNRSRSRNEETRRSRSRSLNKLIRFRRNTIRPKSDQSDNDLNCNKATNFEQKKDATIIIQIDDDNNDTNGEVYKTPEENFVKDNIDEINNYYVTFPNEESS